LTAGFDLIEKYQLYVKYYLLLRDQELTERREKSRLYVQPGPTFIFEVTFGVRVFGRS